MKLETFNDVLASIKKNPDREFHLLLGNGFSMAYDPAIFSYNALHDFITKLDDKDLSTILGVIETRNFEVIMQHLDNFSALITGFGGNPKLKKRIERHEFREMHRRNNEQSRLQNHAFRELSVQNARLLRELRDFFQGRRFVRSLNPAEGRK